MTAIKSPIGTVESLDGLIEVQDLIDVFTSNAKCRLEVAMSYSESTNQQEQKYYNKASGCSVKAQEDNLFDYKSWQKKKHYSSNR